MLIAGVNVGRTRAGMPLKDGGACLLRDGDVVVAIAEERLTREKHAGGFSQALEYCLDAAGVAGDAVDMVVVSTCADVPLPDGSDIAPAIDRAKVRGMPSHHLSHALAAFLTSPFERAAIMVLDNEGNALSPVRKPYWGTRVERNSYYLGEGGCIQRLEAADDRLAVDELGPGEAYRHFTYFLGWPSYVYAGNTMGLAPFGCPDVFGRLRVFDLANGSIHTRLANGRDDPPRSIDALAQELGVDVGPRRRRGEALTPRHSDLAAAIQLQLEEALIYKALELHRLTGATDLCLGGGLALNCVANRRLLNETPFERVHVSFAPGDSGQCLGNALYGWTVLADGARPDRPPSPYLGRDYSDQAVEAALADGRLTWRRPESVADDTARLLEEGRVVGWFQGRSELGPRALGARSILADPRRPAMRDYLNALKGRESFRPFAPSVLEQAAGGFCDLPQRSPFMELTASVRREQRQRIPAVTHTDGSARPQTVGPDANPAFVALIEAFHRRTGVPLVLNTSFNLAGEPIVERPEDAVSCFSRSGLDVLVVGDRVVERAGEPGFRRWARNGGAPDRR